MLLPEEYGRRLIRKVLAQQQWTAADSTGQQWMVAVVPRGQYQAVCDEQVNRRVVGNGASMVLQV